MLEEIISEVLLPFKTEYEDLKFNRKIMQWHILIKMRFFRKFNLR